MTPYSPVDIHRVSKERVVSILRVSDEATRQRARRKQKLSSSLLPVSIFGALFNPED
jgi:hypothetical protein